MAQWVKVPDDLSSVPGPHMAEREPASLSRPLTYAHGPWRCGSAQIRAGECLGMPPRRMLSSCLRGFRFNAQSQMSGNGAAHCLWPGEVPHWEKNSDTQSVKERLVIYLF